MTDRVKLWYVLAVAALVAWPAAAALPAECTNIPDSAGPVPAELIATCSGQAESPLAPTAATDMAAGWEAVGAALNTLVLNTPEVLTIIGGTPPASFVGACEFAGDNPYAIYCLDASSPGTLFAIDTATGATVTVGNPVPFGTESFSSLDWDPTTGTMYAASTDVATGSIYTIDVVAGTAARIGATTAGLNCPIAGGFNAAGTYFLYDICTDSMYSVDKGSGAAVLLGPLGFDANFGQGMDFDPDDDTCYLFAFNNGSFQAELRTCNTTDGSTALVGVLGATVPGALVQLGGAGVAPARPILQEIPTLGQFGLLLLAAGLGGAAIRRFRRR